MHDITEVTDVHGTCIYQTVDKRSWIICDNKIMMLIVSKNKLNIKHSTLLPFSILINNYDCLHPDTSMFLSNVIIGYQLQHIHIQCTILLMASSHPRTY